MTKVTKDIYYVGVNDHQVDLFEGQYVVPNGMAYNSYVIKDEKTVKKIKMELPTSVEKIIKCKNPRCITTTEHYVPQVFKLVDKEKALYCCEYCDAIYKAGPQRETVDLFE